MYLYSASSEKAIQMISSLKFESDFLRIITKHRLIVVMYSMQCET
jgi:hypothetical protein